MSPLNSRREFNTPHREAWNGPISQVLKAIDAHNECFWRTGERWHLEKAQELRVYVRELKEWIKSQEQAQ